MGFCRANNWYFGHRLGHHLIESLCPNCTLLSSRTVNLMTGLLTSRIYDDDYCKYSLSTPSPQKLTTFDSATKFANFIGSMKEAFKVFRSSSVTPRATEQAPQTYTGTPPSTTLSINSGRGGKPTP
jgi:hypothetical protein